MENAAQPPFWKRGIRRRWIVVASVAVIALVFYTMATWLARSDWDNYRRNYESHVASLDFLTYIPKPIPDASNFAATPVTQPFFASTSGSLFNTDAFAQADGKIPNPESASAKRARNLTDLVAWQQAFEAVRNKSAKAHDRFRSGKFDVQSRSNAASAVLDGLAQDQGILDEFRAASSRPQARYPVNYNLKDPWLTLIPHVSKIKQACFRLDLRACAELALDRGDAALDDVRLILYMADSLKTEPFAISYAVRLSCFQIAAQPIWEGLSEHRWSDSRLQQLQSQMEQHNFLADMAAPLHTERALAILAVDSMKRQGLGALNMVNSPYSLGLDDKTLNVLGRVLPSAWYNREKLQYCLLADRHWTLAKLSYRGADANPTPRRRISFG